MGLLVYRGWYWLRYNVQVRKSLFRCFLVMGLAGLLGGSPLCLFAQGGEKSEDLPKLTQKKIDSLGSAALKWAENKAADKRIAKIFREKVTAEYKDSGPKIDKGLKELWALMDDVEATETKRIKGLNATLDMGVELGWITIGQMAREKVVLSKIRTLRMYILYANLFPRILKEWITDDDGKYIGDRFAGYEWNIGIDWNEGKALHYVYYDQLTYFIKEDMNKKLPGQKAASKF